MQARKTDFARRIKDAIARDEVTNVCRKWWPHEKGARIKPLPPSLTRIGGKGLFNPQKRYFLDEPHHARIAKIEQIQGDDNIKTNADKG